MSFAKQFVGSVSSLSFANVFNPYSQNCPKFDLDDASHRRAALLEDILTKAEAQGVDSIWIGRDLGHRGGRRTGLALTDDFSFRAHLRRWNSVAEPFTTGAPVREQTATVIWELLEDVSENVFLWNVFPLHPHPPENEFGNRKHTASERNDGLGLLDLLVDHFKPSRIIAIGNDAADAATLIAGQAEIFPVRHPSYGGQQDFRRQVNRIYGARQNSFFDLTSP